MGERWGRGGGGGAYFMDDWAVLGGGWEGGVLKGLVEGGGAMKNRVLV